MSFSGLSLKPPSHVAFLGEGPVAVFRVVAGERQVAERVQPGLLDPLPLWAERRLPGGRQILVLWHDVLDGVLVHRHALLAPVVLQPAKPVASAAEVVEIAGLHVASELLVGGETAVGGQQEEMRLDAFEVAVLLEHLGERGKGLVQRIGGDGADGAAEDVSLRRAGLPQESQQHGSTPLA